jgi:hypothetical protein
MIDSLRRAVVALTLLVLGAGHAACACAAVAGAMAGPDITVSAPSGHSHHTASEQEPKDDHCNESPDDPGHDCTHCVTAALPADASTKAVTPFPADFAILPPPPELTYGSLFRLADLRIEPATDPPPPRSSLVTLKVRLQN